MTTFRAHVASLRRELQKPGHGNLFLGNLYADFPDPDNFFFIFFHSHCTAVPGLNYRTAGEEE